MQWLQGADPGHLLMGLGGEQWQWFMALWCSRVRTVMFSQSSASVLQNGLCPALLSQMGLEYPVARPHGSPWPAVTPSGRWACPFFWSFRSSLEPVQEAAVGDYGAHTLAGQLLPCFLCSLLE